MDLERVNVPQPDKLFLLLGTFTWKEIQATDKVLKVFFCVFFFFSPARIHHNLDSEEYIFIKVKIWPENSRAER